MHYHAARGGLLATGHGASRHQTPFRIELNVAALSYGAQNEFGARGLLRSYAAAGRMMAIIRPVIPWSRRWE